MKPDQKNTAKARKDQVDEIVESIGPDQARAAPVEYVYSFEIMQPYPSVRTFIFKKPLRHSMADSVVELLGMDSKKRPSG